MRMYYSYQHLIYLAPTQDFSFDDFKCQLQKYYHQNQSIKLIFTKPNKIIIDFKNQYSFYLNYNNDETVIVEAQEMFEFFTNDYSETKISDKQKELFKQSTHRIEFYGDTDLDMDYFNEMLFLFDEIQKSLNVVILNME